MHILNTLWCFFRSSVYIKGGLTKMNRKIRDSIDLKYFNTMKEWSHNFIRIR